MVTVQPAINGEGEGGGALGEADAPGEGVALPLGVGAGGAHCKVRTKWAPHSATTAPPAPSLATPPPKENVKEPSSAGPSLNPAKPDPATVVTTPLVGSIARRRLLVNPSTTRTVGMVASPPLKPNTVARPWSELEPNAAPAPAPSP